MLYEIAEQRTMTNKKIAIWGCGDIGHKFIKEYKDKVKIDCIIDSKVKNQKLINIEGTEYSIFNPEYLRTNPVFVIVCIKNSKEQIYSKLKEFGMTMFNDLFRILNLMKTVLTVNN